MHSFVDSNNVLMLEYGQTKVANFLSLQEMRSSLFFSRDRNGIGSLDEIGCLEKGKIISRQEYIAFLSLLLLNFSFFSHFA